MDEQGDDPQGSSPSTGPRKRACCPPQLVGPWAPCMLSRAQHAELASVQVAEWSSSLNKGQCATLVQLLLSWRCSLGRAAAAGLEACVRRNKPTQQVWPVRPAPPVGLGCETKGQAAWRASCTPSVDLLGELMSAAAVSPANLTARRLAGDSQAAVPVCAQQPHAFLPVPGISPAHALHSRSTSIACGLCDGSARMCCAADGR